MDPSHVHYDEPLMRKHLFQCLANKEISSFPKSTKRLKTKGRRTLLFLDVYCLCRDVFIESETETDKEKYMVMCSSCGDWYHKKCLKIPVKIFKSDKLASTWHCTKCF